MLRQHNRQHSIVYHSGQENPSNKQPNDNWSGPGLSLWFWWSYSIISDEVRGWFGWRVRAKGKRLVRNYLSNTIILWVDQPPTNQLHTQLNILTTRVIAERHWLSHWRTNIFYFSFFDRFCHPSSAQTTISRLDNQSVAKTSLCWYELGSKAEMSIQKVKTARYRPGWENPRARPSVSKSRCRLQKVTKIWCLLDIKTE